MLKIHSVQARKVFLRNVTVPVGPQFAFSGTKCSVRALAGFEPETSKREICQQSPCDQRSESNVLTFKVPGLSTREESFLRQQIRIILKPDCMREASHGEPYTHGHKSFSFLDRGDFERVFPTDGLSNLAAFSRQIEKVFPEFRIDREDLRMKQKLNPILCQRVVEGLQLSGFTANHICKNPNLVLSHNPSQAVFIAEIAEVGETDLSTVMKFSKLKLKVLKDNFVDNYVCKIAQSLEELGFPEEACQIRRTNFGGLQTLTDLHWNLSQPVLKAINRRRGFDVDVDKCWMERSKAMRSKGPVQMARNYYIFEEILRQKKRGKRTKRFEEHFRFYLYPDPLESLIALNCYYAVSADLDPDNMKSTEKFLKALGGGFTRVMRTQSPELLVSVRRQILSDIGFTDKEISEILLSYEFLRFSDSSADLSYTSPDFVAIMKERWSLLRANLHNLGITDTKLQWAVLTNWSLAMSDLALILDNNETCGQIITTKFTRKKEMIPIEISSTDVLPHKRESLPTIKFLSKYFKTSTKVERKDLTKSTFPNVYFPSVPLSRIHQTLNLLVARDFTQDQIRDATPLLFFPPNLVAQKLDEIESNSESEDKDRILQICLYHIEREFNFTSDGLFTGRRTVNISDELLAEVDKYRERLATKDFEKKGERQKSLSTHQSRSNFGRPSWPHTTANWSSTRHSGLQANASLFSSHSGFSESPDHYFQKRMFFAGFRGFVLPNPFTWIRVESELIRLQTEWDPSFKKTEFIDGTKHAIQAVTSLIRENKFSELPGLLTTRERTRLFGEVEKEWKDIQRNNIDVEEQDIVSALPVRVLRHNVAYQRFADIDVVFVVHRVRDREVVDSPSIFMIIRVTFTRDYSKGSLPDWTISKFKVEKFSVLPKK